MTRTKLLILSIVALSLCAIFAAYVYETQEPDDYQIAQSGTLGKPTASDIEAEPDPSTNDAVADIGLEDEVPSRPLERKYDLNKLLTEAGGDPERIVLDRDAIVMDTAAGIVGSFFEYQNLLGSIEGGFETAMRYEQSFGMLPSFEQGDVYLDRLTCGTEICAGVLRGASVEMLEMATLQIAKNSEEKVYAMWAYDAPNQGYVDRYLIMSSSSRVNKLQGEITSDRFSVGKQLDDPAKLRPDREIGG